MIHMKQKAYLLILVLALIIPAFAGAELVITVGSVTIPTVGETAVIPVLLSGCDTGVAGYQIQVMSSAPDVAVISGVSIPAWSLLSQATESFPASAIDVVAVDLERVVEPGMADVELFSFTVSAVGEGTAEFSLQVSELTDDSGDAVPAPVTPGTVQVGEGTAGAPEEPVPTPTPDESVPDAPAPVPVTTPVQQEEPEESNTAPAPVAGTINASFVVVPPASGFAPLKVQFVDLSTGLPETFIWDFGDGETFVTSVVNGTVVENPTHVYHAPGTYSVTLTAMNSASTDTHTETDCITVAEPNVPGKKATGNFQMDSHPQGAEVYLNGAYYGVTPIRISDLMPATYQVRLKMDGFRDWVRAYDVFAGPYPSCRTTVAMQPIHQGFGQHNISEYPEGSAYIVSYPEGVTVLIDGKQMGTTDLMITGLLPGDHTVTLQRDGFAEWTDSITIKETRTTMQVYTYEEPYYKKTTAIL